MSSYYHPKPPPSSPASWSLSSMNSDPTFRMLVSQLCFSPSGEDPLHLAKELQSLLEESHTAQAEFLHIHSLGLYEFLNEIPGDHGNSESLMLEGYGGRCRRLGSRWKGKTGLTINILYAFTLEHCFIFKTLCSWLSTALFLSASFI